jgi:hypothetical protein
MTAAAPNVFISYRRDDTSGHAGRLYDAVAERLGQGNVFMDVELKPGVDFVDRITEVVGECRVVLVVIGPAWASPASGEGEGRIADPDDFVRLEVRTALLRSDVSVIPVLVAGARMPEPDGLPEDLRALTRLNALEVSDLRWRYDVGRLLSALDEALAPPGAAPATDGARTSPRARRWLLIAALPAVLVAVAAVLLIADNPTEPSGSGGSGGEPESVAVAKPGETPRPLQVDVGVSGEQATLRFEGIRGERMAPDVRNVTAPAKIAIVDPADETIRPPYSFNDSTLLRTEKCGTPVGCQPLTLKRSGTHKLIISGDSDHTGSLDLRLYAVADDVRSRTAFGSPPVRLVLGVGQAAMVTFPWRGDRARLVLRLLDIELDGYVNVRDPSGRLALKDTGFFGSEGERKLPVSVSKNGTYTIYMRTNDNSSGSLRLQLASS